VTGDDGTVIRILRADLLRMRRELLDSMDLRTREHLKNIDHLLGWPPPLPSSSRTDSAS